MAADACVAAHVNAHVDAVGWLPKRRLASTEWPIDARAELSGPVSIQDTLMNDSVVAVNYFGKGTWLQHAMLRRDGQVESAVELSPAIVTNRSMVGRVARTVRAAIDPDNYTPAWDVIGIDLKPDRQRFHASAAEVVVVLRSQYPQVSA